MPKTALVKTEIELVKEEAHKIYKSVGSIWCPAVKDNVVFNRHGWNHLSFKRNGRRRNPEELKSRCRLFKNVPEVVKNSMVSTITSGTIISRRKIKRNVKYYELVYLCGKQTKHTSVVLRRIENQELHYYSVRRTSSKTKKALVKTGLI